jgi:uncharacterized protein YdeI (YjbR/CyaY-like superfamily)
MGERDKRVDAYITKSATIAKPILTQLRELVHRGCPDVEESIKWGFPHFEYKGILCSMAAFKQHCAFGFWKASLMSDPDGIFSEDEAMGHLGRIRSTGDLPADKILIQYVREATKLNEVGVKKSVTIRSAVKKQLVVPDYFTNALQKNKKALKLFEELSPSHKKEYVEWVTEAKTKETRQKRLATSIEWMAGGKIRNWKYARK